MNDKQWVNTIGLHLGESDFCLSVHIGQTPLYLYGTYKQIHDFADEIHRAAWEREKYEVHKTLERQVALLKQRVVEENSEDLTPEDEI